MIRIVENLDSIDRKRAELTKQLTTAIRNNKNKTIRKLESRISQLDFEYLEQLDINH